ncbi:hypothetical protein [Nocardioides coralli]|uniref:hypothetical protein n=1 Tax=Nocardioides coralli TaxID=2872154 RepID=UPI001CA3DA22|nr:hypothetical protein [Nocardioides coralli]QZY28482.1 hypothetical protein K6T13_13565 [Nocardioides coralli]
MTGTGADVTGIHLTRTTENAEEIDALAAVLGGRVGLRGVITDLDRQARPSRLGRLLGRAVDTAYAWQRDDQRDPRWWPQGISSSAEAGGVDDAVHGRRVLVTTWYAKDLGEGSHGCRVTFLDLDTLRYRHVLLVTPTLTAGGPGLDPLRIHAGGVVWRGPWLHVAATRRGFVTFHLDDVLRAGGDALAAFGHTYVLPARAAYRARTAEGHRPLRFSFLSLDRDTSPPCLLAGEYAAGTGEATRLARFGLAADDWPLLVGEDGRSRPVVLEDGGVLRMQGAATARGRLHVTSSHGPWRPGTVHTGHPGALRPHRFAVPMGPEDLTYWPATDRLWTLTEHPGRRWVVSMRRDWFD